MCPHRVEYDDGDEECVNLVFAGFRLLDCQQQVKKEEYLMNSIRLNATAFTFTVVGARSNLQKGEQRSPSRSVSVGHAHA